MTKMNAIKMKFAVAFAAILMAGVVPAKAQSGLRQVPLGFCALSSMSSATPFSSCVMASFTGSGSGTNLTVTSVTGLIQPGETLSGTGAPAGTTVVSQKSGTPGGAGVYVTSAATTSSSASLTANGLPTAVSYAVICAYAQGVVYRDDGVAPTVTAGTGGQGIAAGQCIPYNGTFSKFQAIQQAGGAILGASFYN